MLSENVFFVYNIQYAQDIDCLMSLYFLASRSLEFLSDTLLKIKANCKNI